MTASLNGSAKPSIRVAMIIQAYYPYPHIGGAERQIAQLAPLLKERGVSVDILTRRYPGLSPFELIDGVPVHRLPIPGPKALKSLAFTASALPVLRRIKPDVIHAHELLSPTTTAVLAKRIFKTPVAAKVLRGGSLGDIAKLKGRGTGMRRFDSFRKQVDAFITISAEINDELAALGIPAAQRPFIPNGVDTDRFKPVSTEEKAAVRRRLNLPAGTITVFMGRLSPEKRVDQLVDVWPAIRAAYKDANLVILGTGPEEETLKQRAGAGVIFAGRIADVVPYLQAADIFVLPSSTEGLSNAMLEGMAMGLAVVATDVGGAPDLIQHGQSGWLIPPDTPAKLEEAFITLLADTAARQAMGQKARQKVEQEYALAAVADRLRQLYDRLLSH